MATLYCREMFDDVQYPNRILAYNVYTIQMDHSEKRKYTKCLLLLLLLAYYYVHSHPPTQGLIYGAD
jgi:hypothetical protein